MTDDDWRLMGQETWLTGRQLRQTEWFPRRDGWDHDHCAFCEVEIAAPTPVHHGLTAGYVTCDDSCTWVCPECFEDFKFRLRWSVLEAEDQDDNEEMQRRVDLSNIDLDAIASLIHARRTYWRALGLTAKQLTWMDNTDVWPAPLLRDRAAVVNPRSLGICISCTEGAEAEFVVYAGGWTDVDWIASDRDHPISEYVELNNAQDFAVLLDRVVGRLVMEDTPAESLTIGDRVELPAQPAPVLIRLTLIKPRVKRIKIEGRTDGGTLYRSSFPYGGIVRRKASAQPKTPADAD